MSSKSMDYLKKWMTLALDEAKQAYNDNEIPVGAVIVKDNKLIATGRNTRELTQDVTAHAEINALRKACAELGTWNLTGCDMYVTVEPCPMCAGAILQARIKSLFIAACDSRWGAAGSSLDLFDIKSYNHKTDVFYHVMETESKELLYNFFRKLRDTER